MYSPAPAAENVNAASESTRRRCRAVTYVPTYGRMVDPRRGGPITSGRGLHIRGAPMFRRPRLPWLAQLIGCPWGRASRTWPSYGRARAGEAGHGGCHGDRSTCPTGTGAAGWAGGGAGWRCGDVRRKYRREAGRTTVSSSTRPASVLPNCLSMIRSGSSGLRFTLRADGGSPSQTRNESEASCAARRPPKDAWSAGEASVLNAYCTAAPDDRCRASRARQDPKETAWLRGQFGVRGGRGELSVHLAQLGGLLRGVSGLRAVRRRRGRGPIRRSCRSLGVVQPDDQFRRADGPR